MRKRWRVTCCHWMVKKNIENVLQKDRFTMNRRQFIQRGTLAIAGTAVALPALAKGSRNRIGLQLYTLRDIITKDPKSVLKQVADLGYQDLEVYGYNDGMLFGMKSKEFANYVRSLGMKITSGHYQLGKNEQTAKMKGTILNGWEQACADAKETGQEFMVVAYLNADERQTIDDYRFVCDEMNRASLVCKKYGIKLQYHNHDFEFQKFDGVVAYDVMLKQLDSKLVGMELDLYWTVFAGINPTDLFAKYPGRFQQWHIKDMDKIDRKKNAIVGTGSIDFKSLLTHAKEAGLKHWYMEHDSYPEGMSSSDSVKADVAYLKTF